MRGDAARAHVRGAVAVVVAGLLAACADPSRNPGASGGPPRARGPSLPSLLGRLATATVQGDLCGLDGALAAKSASTIVFTEEFDRPLAPEWFDGAWQKELAQDAKAPRHARASLMNADGVSVALLDAAAGGLHHYLPAPGDESYLVTARMRIAQPATGGGLWVIPHRSDAPTSAQLATRVLTPALENDGRSVALEATTAGAWRELALFVPAEPGRRSLSLSLLPSTAGADVDRVVVRRLSVAAALRFTPRVSFDRPAGEAGAKPGPNAELRRVLTLARGATCDALLVPCGASVTFALDVPALDINARPPRFSFIPGALAASEGGAAELAVRVDGESLLRLPLPAAPATSPRSLAAVTVDLARFAGRRVALELAASASGDAVAFFGAPALLFPRGDPAASAPRRNLLLISLDTLRADLLGCYGDARGLSPAIDAVAAAGSRFATTWSPSCYTLPTHMSLMTGQHPLVHGAFSPLRAVDPLRSPSLAARLRAAGWRTAAFTGGGFVQPLHGFGQGFEQYGVDDPSGRTSLRRDAQKSAAAAAEAQSVGADPLAPTLTWLRANADQPFFLFVHTYFVHNYAPEPRFLARVGGPDVVGAPIAEDRPLELRELARKGDAAALARLKALYAGTLAQVDELLVRRLLATLAELRLADDTVVCILSDHGEEQLEHGSLGHGHELFDESTRVPWILRGPGVPAGAVHAGPVDLADVAPTLAHLLGLPADPEFMQARDRLAGGEDDDDAAHVLVLDGSDAPPLRDALVIGPWKLMRFRRDGGELEQRLYEIARDPGERDDLAASEPAKVRALAGLLEQRRRELAELARALPGADQELTADQLKAQEAEMRALGYLGE